MRVWRRVRLFFTAPSLLFPCTMEAPAPAPASSWWSLSSALQYVVAKVSRCGRWVRRRRPPAPLLPLRHNRFPRLLARFPAADRQFPAAAGHGCENLVSAVHGCVLQTEEVLEVAGADLANALDVTKRDLAEFAEVVKRVRAPSPPLFRHLNAVCHPWLVFRPRGRRCPHSRTGHGHRCATDRGGRQVARLLRTGRGGGHATRHRGGGG